MAAKGWFSRQLKKMRDAGMPEEAVSEIEREGKDALPPDAWEGDGGGDGDQHFHVHFEKPARGDDADPAADPDAGGGEGAAPTAAEFAALCEKVEKLEAMVLGDEEEVELEDQDTQDKRRFKLRRRDALKTRDQDPPTPERAPEMMGETDLPGTEDLEKTTDSAKLEPLWQTAIANAELIVPGYRLPTFDAAHRPLLTAKRLCALRRGVVADALKDEKVAPIVRSFIGDADPKRMVCDALKIAFDATAAAIKNGGGNLIRSTAVDATGRRTGDDAPKAPPTIAEMNAAARKMWDDGGNGAVRR